MGPRRLPFCDPLQRGKRLGRVGINAADYNAGHQASYTELAAEGFLKGKKWLAVSDDDTRQMHEDLNGVEVGADEDFDVGSSSAPYPGHASLPADERVNCRCTTVASVVKE